MEPLEARIRASFDRQTFMQHLGAQLARVVPGCVEITLQRDQRLLQQHGFLHAGVVNAMLDSACGYAALTVMEDDAAVLSVEFKTNLVAPAAGEHFMARGTVLRAGRTLVVCRGDAFVMDADPPRLVAAMQCTMMTVRGQELKD